MFMRYRGGGVGHKSIQKAIQKFRDDRWPDELKGVREHEEMEDQRLPAMDDSGEDSDVAEGSFLEPILNPDADELLEDDVDPDLAEEESEHEDGPDVSESDSNDSDDELEYIDP